MDGVGESSWEVSAKIGAELRRLRTERGLSLSAFAGQVHYSKGYLSKLETGDKRITGDVAQACDKALQTGGSLTALVARQRDNGPAQEPDQIAEREPTSEDCPYRGLAAFGTGDARWFFGRKRITADLVGQLGERLAGGAPLAVVAPSGAGKSSLLQAGLVPALTSGALPGSGHWLVVPITPTDSPLAALATGLARVTGRDPVETAAAVEDSQCFVTLLASIADGAGWETRETACSRRIVFIVDQFEETFTECQDEAERRAFIGALCAAARNPAALVVLGLRADFYGRCLAYPALLASLREGHLPLGPMSTEELREAIIRPADAEGLRLEPGLVELLLSDLGVLDSADSVATGCEAGALPLLSHALLATWQQRDGRVLTVAGYRRTDGIRAAIATTAERAYTRLSPTEQQIAQQILLRLVQVNAQTGDVRRRLPRHRLLQSLTTPAEATDKILEVFGRARLLTFDTDSVEITHEALLRAWPRLAGWINADRAGLHIHQQLSESAEVWDTEDRDPFLLYRGSRLTIAQDWAASPRCAAQLNAVEVAYLESSIGQKQREQLAERHRSRRLRKSVGVLAVSLVVALLAAGIAFQQYHVAVTQRRLAIVAELNAKSGYLAAKEPEAAMLLGVEAYHLEQGPATRGGLLSAQSQYFLGELTGHNGIIYTVTFSHDRHILATASADGTARLWDVTSHQPIATFDGNSGPNYDAEFSPNDRILAVTGRDGTVRLWDLASRSQIAILPGVTGVAVYAATFSHDGRLLASTDKGGTVRLWDVASRQQIATFNGRTTDPVFGAEFSPDDRTLATASADGTAQLWDVASHQSVTTLAGHVGRVNNVRFSPDGHILVTVGDDAKTILWDVASHQPIATLNGNTGAVNDAAFSPSGQLLLTGGGDGTARLWDVATHKQVGNLAGYSSIIGVSFNRDGRTVATASEDNTARLWDTGGPIVTPTPATVSYEVVFSPDGRTLATADEDGTARLWNVATHQPIATLDGHAGVVWSVAFSPDGRTLATADGDGTARLWNVATHQPIATLDGHAGAVRSVAFSPDGRTLVTACDDGAARLWDLTSYQQVTTLFGHTAIVYAATFSHHGDILATASADGTVRLWGTVNHQPIATISAHSGTIDKLAFSPDDRILATAGDDGVARLWDVASRHQVASLPGHVGAIESVAFSQDGHTLATAGGDATTKLWNVDTQQLIATLTGHTDAVYGVAFSPTHGQLLATVGGDTTMRLWDLDVDRVTDHICRIIGAVNREQWARLIPELPFQPTCH